MNSDPIFIREGADEKEALDLMQEKTVEQIPILDKDDTITGIHLLRDLVKESQKIQGDQAINTKLEFISGRLQ